MATLGKLIQAVLGGSVKKTSKTLAREADELLASPSIKKPKDLLEETEEVFPSRPLESDTPRVDSKVPSEPVEDISASRVPEQTQEAPMSLGETLGRFLRSEEGIFIGSKGAKRLADKGKADLPISKGREGERRFEINDSNSHIKMEALEEKPALFTNLFREQDAPKIGVRKEVFSKNMPKLEEVLEHPTLFEAYPELRRARVEAGIGNIKGGFYISRDGEVRIVLGDANSIVDIHSTIIHETQHAVQRVEGFARGGSPGEFTDDLLAKEVSQIGDKVANSILRRDIDEIRKGRESLKGTEWGKFFPNLLKEIDRLLKKEKVSDADFLKISDVIELDMTREAFPKTAFQKYTELAGEVEARNAQTRLKLSKETRKRIKPETSEDVSRAGQRVIKREGKDFFLLESTPAATNTAIKEAIALGTAAGGILAAKPELIDTTNETN